MATYTPINSAALASLLAGGTLSSGDIIELEVGVTYALNSTLPSLGLSAPVTIRSAGYENWGKARYSRAVAADVTNMATLVPTGNHILAGPFGAGWYEFFGLHGATDNPATSRNALLYYGLDNSTSTNPYPLASMPKLTVRHCVFKDCVNVRNAVVANSGLTIIESSTIGPVLKNGEEPHALVEWSGLGPFLIQNNSISCNAIGVLFGGAMSIVASATSPTGIFRCNHVWGDPAWGSTWYRKNLMEFKHGRGWLVEGNVFSGHWVDAQGGAYLFNDIDDTNGEIARIVTRYNKWYDCGGSWWVYGYNLKPYPRSYDIHDNLFIGGMDPRDSSLAPNTLFQWVANPKDVWIHHNTVISANESTATNAVMGVMTPASPSFGYGTLDFRDNIIVMPWQTDVGFLLAQDSNGANKAGLDSVYAGGSYQFRRNAICRETPQIHALPTDNDYYTGSSRVADMLAKLESNYAVKAVQSGTDWNTYGTDGGRIGCNIPALEQWIDGVESGEPTALQRGMHLIAKVV